MEPHLTNGHAASATRNSTRVSVSDIQDSFRKLCNELPEHENLRYSAKLVVLLDRAGARQMIGHALNAGHTDYCLPILPKYLPRNLSPTAYKNITDLQPHFLDDSFELSDRHNRRHYHLNQDAISTENPVELPCTLQWVGILGQGGSADVSEVQAADGKHYALKTIQRKTDYIEAMTQMKFIKEEIEILKRISHKHCIKLAGSYTNLQTVGMVLDPAADSNMEMFLDDWPQSDTYERQVTLASFFGCLTETLVYLHFVLHIRHKDIKPRNILVKGKTVLLTDFGISLDWNERGRTTTWEEKRRSSVYCAPEAAATDTERNTMTDIWSLGCVFLEMVTVLKGRPRSFVEETLTAHGSRNFRDNPEGIEEVIRTLRSEGSPCDDKPLDWVTLMLQDNKDRRPTSRMLKDMILQRRGENKRVFCGFCCGKESDNHREAASASPSEGAFVGSSVPIRAGRDDMAQPNVVSVVAHLHDDKKGEWHPVNVIESRQSVRSWIVRELALEHHLDIKCGRHVEVLEYQGECYRSESYTSFIWNVHGQQREGVGWMVLDTAPFDMLAGRDSGIV